MHIDCGAWGGSKSFGSKTQEINHHLAVINKTSRIIARRFPDLAIAGYLIGLDRKNAKWIISPKKLASHN